MSFSNIHELFNQHLDKNIVNQDTHKLVKSFRLSWANKGDDYTGFLGNNLTGVYVIKFTPADEESFFSIFNIDGKQLQKDVYKTKGINKDFRTISNSVYLTCVYMMHKVYSSKMNMNDKNDFIKELYFIMAYKIISSLNMHYFKYPISVNVAKAINERMSAKFLIKKVSSWQELFDIKSQDVQLKGIQARRLTNGDTDDICRVITDLQTRLREIFKNNYAVFIEVNEQSEKIASSSMVQLSEEGDEFKSVTDAKSTYLTNLKNIIGLEHDFIKDDLIHLHTAIFKGIDEFIFRNLLKHISKTIQTDKKNYEMFENSFAVCIDYIVRKGIYKDFIRSIYEIMMILKGMYCASNVTDPNLKMLKRELPKYVKKVTKLSNFSQVNITANALIVYLVTRSFYK